MYEVLLYTSRAERGERPVGRSAQERAQEATLEAATVIKPDHAASRGHFIFTEEQKQRFLVPGIKGERIGCLAITEPGAGSDVAGIRTKAVRDGDEYAISGSKIFITNGARADFILLVAKTDPSARHEGITLFLVDLRDSDGNPVPGFSVSRTLEKMGMHASDTAELAFDELRVPADSVLGEPGKGFYHISWELQGERLVA